MINFKPRSLHSVAILLSLSSYVPYYRVSCPSYVLAYYFLEYAYIGELVDYPGFEFLIGIIADKFAIGNISPFRYF